MDSNQKGINLKKINNSEDFINNDLDKNLNFKGGPWVIVGFDPGLTVGIAILDLSGNLMSLTSFKEISRAEVINHIMSYGRALIIASDVYPPPKSVKKLATALNSKIYSPSKLLSVESKKELVDSFIQTTDHLIENAHQRDALAAAIKTYKHYEKKLHQIEKRTRELNLSSEKIDHIKNLVITGTPITKAINEVMNEKTLFFIPTEQEKAREEYENEHNSIEPKINSLEDSNSKKSEFETISKLKKRIRIQEKQIKNQEGIIKNLRDKNKIYRNKIQKNKKELTRLKFRIEKLHSEYSQGILLKKELSSKLELIKKLINQYNQEKIRRKKLEENLKSIQKIKNWEISENSVPVKIVKSFTKDGIKKASDYWKIRKGDVILLTSSKGGGSTTAALLVEIGLRAIIVQDKMSHQAKEVFERENIPVISADKLETKLVDEFAIVKYENLKDEIDKWNIKIKELRKKEEEKKLWTVIDEYRAKRKRRPL